MFEINSHMIHKMGWWLYHPNLGLGFDYPGLFVNDNWVRFFFIDKSNDMIFIIKEMTPKEKQKTKSLYKFIEFNYNDIKNSTPPNIKNFNSNQQLWKLIIENEAYGENYKRHFRLNKILK